jgi:hypothetical protein
LEITLNILIEIGPTLICRHQTAEGISNDTDADLSLNTTSSIWMMTTLLQKLSAFQIHIQRVFGDCFHRRELPSHKADHSPPFSVEVKN